MTEDLKKNLNVEIKWNGCFTYHRSRNSLQQYYQREKGEDKQQVIDLTARLIRRNATKIHISTSSFPERSVPYMYMQVGSNPKFPPSHPSMLTSLHQKNEVHPAWTCIQLLGAHLPSCKSKRSAFGLATFVYIK